jgi:hypothetical protein
MPGTKNPTAPQSTNTPPAMQAYPTMTIPAEIALQFTCRRGSEGIVTVIGRTLRKTGDRRLCGPVRAVVQAIMVGPTETGRSAPRPRRFEEGFSEEERAVIARFLIAATEATHRHAERAAGQY